MSYARSEALARRAAETGGDVGDETLLSAFADAVRRFAPKYILIALRGKDHSAWQESEFIDRARSAFDIR